MISSENHNKIRSPAMKSWQRDINERMYGKYAQSQNYYYTRELNELLSAVRSAFTIQYTDNMVFLEDEEFLRRIYELNEYPAKVKLLTEYYKFHTDIPRLFMEPLCDIMNRMHDKKRRVEFYRIAKIIEEENKKNPSQPPKGIVGEAPPPLNTDESGEEALENQSDLPSELADFLKDITITVAKNNKSTFYTSDILRSQKLLVQQRPHREDNTLLSINAKLMEITQINMESSVITTILGDNTQLHGRLEDFIGFIQSTSTGRQVRKTQQIVIPLLTQMQPRRIISLPLSCKGSAEFDTGKLIGRGGIQDHTIKFSGIYSMLKKQELTIEEHFSDPAETQATSKQELSKRDHFTSVKSGIRSSEPGMRSGSGEFPASFAAMQQQIGSKNIVIIDSNFSKNSSDLQKKMMMMMPNSVDLNNNKIKQTVAAPVTTTDTTTLAAGSTVPKISALSEAVKMFPFDFSQAIKGCIEKNRFGSISTTANSPSSPLKETDKDTQSPQKRFLQNSQNPRFSNKDIKSYPQTQTEPILSSNKMPLQRVINLTPTIFDNIQQKELNKNKDSQKPLTKPLPEHIRQLSKHEFIDQPLLTAQTARSPGSTTISNAQSRQFFDLNLNQQTKTFKRDSHLQQQQLQQNQKPMQRPNSRMSEEQQAQSCSPTNQQCKSMKFEQFQLYPMASMSSLQEYGQIKKVKPSHSTHLQQQLNQANLKNPTLFTQHSHQEKGQNHLTSSSLKDLLQQGTKQMQIHLQQQPLNYGTMIQAKGNVPQSQQRKSQENLFSNPQNKEYFDTARLVAAQQQVVGKKTNQVQSFGLLSMPQSNSIQISSNSDISRQSHKYTKSDALLSKIPYQPVSNISTTRTLNTNETRIHTDFDQQSSAILRSPSTSFQNIAPQALLNVIPLQNNNSGKIICSNLQITPANTSTIQASQIKLSQNTPKTTHTQSASNQKMKSRTSSFGSSNQNNINHNNGAINSYQSGSNQPFQPNGPNFIATLNSNPIFSSSMSSARNPISTQHGSANCGQSPQGRLITGGEDSLQLKIQLTIEQQRQNCGSDYLYIGLHGREQSATSRQLKSHSNTNTPTNRLQINQLHPSSHRTKVLSPPMHGELKLKSKNSVESKHYQASRFQTQTNQEISLSPRKQTFFTKN